MNYISNIEMFTVFIVRSKGIIQDYTLLKSAKMFAPVPFF